jgi:cytochrome P450
MFLGEEVRVKRSVAKGSFLQLMISASHKATGKPFSDIEIVQQALTFLLAG